MAYGLIHLFRKYAPEASCHQVNDLLSVKHTVTDQRPPTAHQDHQGKSPSVRYLTVFTWFKHTHLAVWVANTRRKHIRCIKNGVHSPASVFLWRGRKKTHMNLDPEKAESSSSCLHTDTSVFSLMWRTCRRRSLPHLISRKTHIYTTFRRCNFAPWEVELSPPLSERERKRKKNPVQTGRESWALIGRGQFWLLKRIWLGDSYWSKR